MAMMLRAALELALHDDTRWYADRRRVGALVDVVLDTDLGGAFTHAGRYAAEKVARKPAAIRKAMITGTSDPVRMRDGAGTSVSFDLDDDSLRVTISICPPALTTRAGTILDTIEAITRGVVDVMADLGGLAHAAVRPMGEGFTYPRVRPPVFDRRFPTDSILDVVDLAFHRGDHAQARGAIARKLARAAMPKPAKRRVEGDLVFLRWIADVADPRAVALATGRHEQWIAGLVPMEREHAYNAAGDLRVELSERTTKAPFTFYDPEERLGYKAIVVDARGKPDPAVWKQLVAARKGKVGVRLIAPLRKLALALAPRAAEAGFDAVLYPEDDALWDPSAPGWWIADEA